MPRTIIASILSQTGPTRPVLADYFPDNQMYPTNRLFPLGRRIKHLRTNSPDQTLRPMPPRPCHLGMRLRRAHHLDHHQRVLLRNPSIIIPSLSVLLRPRTLITITLTTTIILNPIFTLIPIWALILRPTARLPPHRARRDHSSRTQDRIRVPGPHDRRTTSTPLMIGPRLARAPPPRRHLQPLRPRRSTSSSP